MVFWLQKNPNLKQKIHGEHLLNKPGFFCKNTVMNLAAFFYLQKKSEILHSEWSVVWLQKTYNKKIWALQVAC